MSNPFSTPDDNYNPFAASNSAWDNPNPSGFGDTSNSIPGPNNYVPYTPPASQEYLPLNPEPTPTKTPSYAPPSSGQRTNGFRDPISGMTYSQEDFEKRETALARKEREIAEKERLVQNGTYQKPGSRRNFPPLIKLWEYYPEQDLPANSLRLVNQVKWIYLSIALCYLMNGIIAFCCFAPGAAKRVESVATLIVLASIFFVVFSPLSFEVSFFVLYNSLKDGKGLKFFCFMVTMFIWWGFLIFNLIGFTDMGSVGFVVMINLFGAEENKWVGGFALVFCIAGTLVAIWMGFVFVLLIRYWRNEGLQNKALSEASVIAVDYAKEHPDVAMSAANVAVNSTYT